MSYSCGYLALFVPVGLARLVVAALVKHLPEVALAARARHHSGAEQAVDFLGDGRRLGSVYAAEEGLGFAHVALEDGREAADGVGRGRDCFGRLAGTCSLKVTEPSLSRRAARCCCLCSQSQVQSS